MAIADTLMKIWGKKRDIVPWAGSEENSSNQHAEISNVCAKRLNSIKEIVSVLILIKETSLKWKKDWTGEEIVSIV